MTLSERNALFKAGILFCFIITLLVIAASYIIIPFYSVMEENTRPVSLLQTISGWFLKSNNYAVHVSLIMAVLFSFIGIILIHFFFERTTAPEILYISLFTVTFSFEILRLIFPLHLIYTFPSFYLIGSTKVLIFARYFSVFSLFTASLCAAGLEIQKTRNIIMAIFIAVVALTFGIPVDTESWDTSFNIVNGFTYIFRMIDMVIFIATVITFFAAAKVRGSREYIYIGIGAAFAFSGRNILIGTDNWTGPIIGILLLSFGTWFICSKLHKIHLWL
jgi:hypothetical protein